MPFSVLFSCVHFNIFSDKKLEPESHFSFLLLPSVSETCSAVIMGDTLYQTTWFGLDLQGSFGGPLRCLLVPVHGQANCSSFDILGRRISLFAGPKYTTGECFITIEGNHPGLQLHHISNFEISFGGFVQGGGSSDIIQQGEMLCQYTVPILGVVPNI